ncbi:MAG: hypothetical protein ACQEVA_02415 [Myxococcota bacterium]
MSHGRRHTTRSNQPRSRIVVAALVAVWLAGCAADDAAPEPEDDETTRTWSVDSGESSEDDTGSEDDSAGSVEDAGDHDAGSGSDDADATDDATDDADSNWQAIRCEDGHATEAAFEGTARNPATRLTFYVRDDCALIGTIATSMTHGNFSLSLRGSVDDHGDLSLAGSNRDHQCDISGAMSVDDAEASVSATFDGADFQRDMTLQRID